jgi:hypothetical protein
MRLLARGAPIVIISLMSLSANAADINYPSPLAGQPQYGMPSPPPALAPPQIIIVPAPTILPHYDNAAIPPAPGPPYGMAQPMLPRAEVAPRSTCAPVWQCGERGCGWQPSCVPPPERYSGRYESPGPVYPDTEPPDAYSAPDFATPPERYPGPYAPQLYPGPAGPAQ